MSILSCSNKPAIIKTKIIEVPKLVYMPIDKELLTCTHNIIIKDDAKYIDLINYLVDAFGVIAECRLKLNQIDNLTNSRED